MKKQSYEFKLGRGQAVNAQVVGGELTRIAEEHGTLSPALVVEESTPTAAPLHPCFEWRNSVAGIQWRLHQARNLINAVVVVRADLPPMTAFINITKIEDVHDRAYVSCDQVVQDPLMRSAHLGAIKSRLKNLRREHSSFEEFAKVWDAIDLL